MPYFLPGFGRQRSLCVFIREERIIVCFYGRAPNARHWCIAEDPRPVSSVAKEKKKKQKERKHVLFVCPPGLKIVGGGLQGSGGRHAIMQQKHGEEKLCRPQLDLTGD